MNVRGLLLTLFVVSLSVFAFAGSACNKATVLNGDGRILDFDFVAPTSANYYQFNVSANHSYSVEVRQDYDDLQSGTPDLTTAAFTDSACSVALGNANTLAANNNVHHTENNDPALPANSQRFSFTPTASGTVYLAVTNSNASTGRYVSITVAETTIFYSRWSTFSGFSTQWAYQNTSSQPVAVTLTVIDTLGSPLMNPNPIVVSFSVAAGSEVFQLTPSTVAAPAQHGGPAFATTDGPPGAVLPDCYFINGTATIVVPSTISPVRQSAH
ncbi:MAG TPA: hypothetical protein VK738_13555 [Terriglobales bacterium]|jgi:hypothetical protein|nr:hypothetical protein [Terriglobales bacterium]